MAARYQSIAEIFKSILDKYADGIGQAEIANLLCISQPTVSRIKKGDLLPPESVVAKISELWGVDISEDVESARKSGSRIANRGSRQPKINQSVGVPYYDVDFVGGFDIVINDQTVTPAYLINFKAYERATCWCNITGHSMEPEINNGDIIALRKIDDLSFLPYGEIYAIVTNNGMRTVKRLGPGTTRDTYMLIPSNKSPEYAPQEISKKNIAIVYEVMGCVKRF